MQIQQKTFSGKLDATLKLMRLSNIAASKLLNIDPSYVSRLRNGTRIPKAGSDLVAGIAQKLGEIIWRKNLVDSMVSLMNSPSIPSQEDSFYDTFLEWFTDFHEENETDTIAVVMDAINEYALPNLSDSTALEKDLFSSLHLSKKLEYEGIRGLQEASARFLVEAYQKDAPLLRLYSDQNMSWISGNPEYYQIWKHLMFACLQRGIKIKIIHYVKREDADLLSGLLSWIPSTSPEKSNPTAASIPKRLLFPIPSSSTTDTLAWKGWSSAGTKKKVDIVTARLRQIWSDVILPSISSLRILRTSSLQ